MAIRSEELGWVAHEDAQIVAFPVAVARARARRERRAEYLRRRVAVLTVAAALAGGLALVSAGEPAVASAEGAPRRIVLQEGATLWEVAQRYAPPGSDLRPYVDALIELNRLDGPVPAGAKITLPR